MLNDLFNELKLLIVEKYLYDRIDLLKLINHSFYEIISAFITKPTKICPSVWLESNSLLGFALLNHIPINYKVFKVVLKKGRIVNVQNLLNYIYPRTIYYFVKHECVKEFGFLLENWRWKFEAVFDEMTKLTMRIYFECDNEIMFNQWNQFLTNYHLTDKEVDLPSKVRTLIERNNHLKNEKIIPKFNPYLIRRFMNQFPQFSLSPSFQYLMTDTFCYKDVVINQLPDRVYQNLITDRITFHREPIISKIVAKRSTYELDAYFEMLSVDMNPQEFQLLLRLFSKTCFHLCYESDWMDPFVNRMVAFEKFNHIPLPFERKKFFRWSNFITQMGFASSNFFEDLIYSQTDLSFFDDLLRDARFFLFLRYRFDSINKLPSSVFHHLNKDHLEDDPNIDMGFLIDEPFKIRKLQICNYVVRLCGGSNNLKELWNRFAIELLMGRLYKKSEPNDDLVIDEFCDHFKSMGICPSDLKLVFFDHIAIHKYPILMRWVKFFIKIDNESLIVCNDSFNQEIIDFIIQQKISIRGSSLLKIEKFSHLQQLLKHKLVHSANTQIIQKLCMKFDRMDQYEILCLKINKITLKH